MKLYIKNVTPVTTDRFSAAKVMLKAFIVGKLTRQIPQNTATLRPNSSPQWSTWEVSGPISSYCAVDPVTGELYSCAIGQLFSPEDRARIEGSSEPYPTAQGLIDRGHLVVPEADVSWFVRAQYHHDRMTYGYNVDEFLAHVIGALVDPAMLPKERKFYKTLHAWVLDGAEDDGRFERSMGICWNAGNAYYTLAGEYVGSAFLVNQFRRAGLDSSLPFYSEAEQYLGPDGLNEYAREKRDGTVWNNPIRRAWVKAHAEYEL